MVVYELRKLLMSKFMPASLAVLAILLGILVFLYRDSFPQETGEGEYYGLFTDENGRIKEDIQAYYEELSAKDMMLMTLNSGIYSDTEGGDFGLISRVMQQSDYALSYPAEMEQIVQRSLADIQRVDEDYEKRYYEKSIYIYNQKVDISVIADEQPESFLMMFHGENSIEYGMVLVLWVIVLGVYTFGFEEDKSFALIVRSTAGGRSALTAAKLLSLAIIILCLGVVILTAELLAGYFIYGMDRNVLTASIQSIQAYKLCDMKLSILGAILLANAARLQLLLMVMGLTVLLTELMKSIPAAVVLTVALEGTLIYLLRMDKSGYMNNMRFMSIRQHLPLGLLFATDYMKSYDYGRIIFWPVNVMYECMVITGLAAVVISAAAIICPEYVNRRKRHGTGGGKPSKGL